MMNLIEETTDYLKEKGFKSPEIGIILGTGLGQLIDHMEVLKEVAIITFQTFQQRLLSFIKAS